MVISIVSHRFLSTSHLLTQVSINKMKRPSSATELDLKPDLITSPSPSPEPKSKRSKSNSSPTKTKTSIESSSKSKPKFEVTGDKMEWNADGREALMDHLIAEGLKGKDKALLAEKVSPVFDCCGVDMGRD
jgi:hypothetical protein